MEGVCVCVCVCVCVHRVDVAPTGQVALNLARVERLEQDLAKVRAGAATHDDFLKLKAEVTAEKVGEWLCTCVCLHICPACGWCTISVYAVSASVPLPPCLSLSLSLSLSVTLPPTVSLSSAHFITLC